MDEYDRLKERDLDAFKRDMEAREYEISGFDAEVDAKEFFGKQERKQKLKEESNDTK